MALPFNFDPGQVLMGRGGGHRPSPYMRYGNGSGPDPGAPTPGAGNDPGFTNTTAPQQSATLGAEAVRASGAGPYDQGYRQNLATYAGGNFFRPGGSLTFDPTGNLFGNPTGGGNAPVVGTGTGLLDKALGGQPFSYNPPPAPTTDAPNPVMGWRDWLDQFNRAGRAFALNL